ncbi:MAG: twin-arginine translocase subunit TatC [Clostridiales bacterium]|nr:twin-arginine translocase subunit TatC [Clostridiales bacterium]
MSKAKRKQETKETKQGFTSHLLALRSMVLRMALVVFAAFLLVFYVFNKPLVAFILQPVLARGIQVIATRVSESLMMQFKLSLVAGLVISMPVLNWEIWRFIGPALYPKEKKAYWALLLTTITLFFVGVVFSYLTVFPLAVSLFYEAGEGIATSMWSVEGYFNFILSFVLPFGLMFELPVVIYLLARSGRVTAQGMGRARRYFILGAAVAAAILTPPDIVSQILLLIPILALYEISVLIARFIKPVEKAEESAA